MTKIKIAIVVRTVGCGGFETVLLNLCDYFSKRSDYDITVITTSEKGKWFDLLDKYNAKSIHVEGRFKTYPYIFALRVGKFVKHKRFDIIMPSNSERFFHAAISILDNNTIVIPWIHSDEPDAYAKALINKKYWNVAVGCGPKVASTAKQLSKNKAVLYIPNGIKVNAPGVLPARSSISQSLKLIFIGRIEQRSKGIFYLPNILNQCMHRKLPVSLIVIGNGNDLPELRDRFNKINLYDKVIFTGALPNEKVYEYLIQSHILIMPSLFEGLPTTPIEAQACGCVPVASNLPGVTDVVIDNAQTGFLVDVGNVNGFVDAIELLFNDDKKWKQMSESGKDKVKNEFSMHAMGQRFEKLFADTMAGKYPLTHSRKWTLPVNPFAFTWREYIPRSVHRLGIGNLFRKLFSKHT